MCVRIQLIPAVLAVLGKSSVWQYWCRYEHISWRILQEEENPSQKRATAQSLNELVLFIHVLIQWTFNPVWYKLQMTPNSYLSYWCHLYFLKMAFICMRYLVCLESEDLSCCWRISRVLAGIRMWELHKIWALQQVSHVWLCPVMLLSPSPTLGHVCARGDASPSSSTSQGWLPQELQCAPLLFTES